MSFALVYTRGSFRLDENHASLEEAIQRGVVLSQQVGCTVLFIKKDGQIIHFGSDLVGRRKAQRENSVGAR